MCLWDYEPMSYKSIQRVALAVLGCSLLSLQTGKCENPSEIRSRSSQEPIKTPNVFPPLQLMTPVEAIEPTELKESKASTIKPVDQAVPVQPSSVGGDVMRGSLGQPSRVPTENYGPEVIELCLAAVNRATYCQFALKRLCVGATTDGDRALIKMLVPLILNGDSGAQADSKENIAGFPCTTLIEILKLEAAHLDLIPMLSSFRRDAVDDRLRSKYQKALQSISSKPTEREMLLRMLQDILSKVMGTYRNYQIEVAEAEHTKADLEKIKEMIAEIRGSETQIEQIKLDTVLRTRESDLERCKERCKRDRQSLIDLVGAEAVTKFDESLKPELKHEI